ncbi:MAG: Rrf2 family transcriptional regulator [Kiloniellales bacterium]
MRLNKATWCALYAVLDLARDSERQVSAIEIADRYGVSANHLAKVLRDLGRGGLVESVRGAGGGYRFAGNVKRTTLYDVVNLFEDIVADDGGRAAPGAETDIGKALVRVLTEIDEIAVATLKSVSLATLIKTMPGPEERKPDETQAASAD